MKKIGNWTVGCVLLLHSTQIGVLWRYFKLFIPVNLTYVKHEVRNFGKEEIGKIGKEEILPPFLLFHYESHCLRYESSVYYD